MLDDERAIRELIDTWLRASKSGDTEKVLSLMTDDVVFMVCGKKPFGKSQFAQGSRALKEADIDSKSEIEELRVLGDWAFCRSHLTVTMTPPGEKRIRRSGYVMTLYQKQPDGRWLLARDTNLLAPEGA